MPLTCIRLGHHFETVRMIYSIELTKFAADVKIRSNYGVTRG